LKAGASIDGAWTTGWRLLDGAGDNLRSWTVASNISVADKNTTPLTQITFAKDGHLTVTPKLEVKSAVTATGVSTRCVKVDLIGRASAQMGACT
jgi:hypothetical protein